MDRKPIPESVKLEIARRFISHEIMNKVTFLSISCLRAERALKKVEGNCREVDSALRSIDHIKNVASTFERELAALRQLIMITDTEDAPEAFQRHLNALMSGNKDINCHNSTEESNE